MTPHTGNLGRSQRSLTQGRSIFAGRHVLHSNWRAHDMRWHLCRIDIISPAKRLCGIRYPPTSCPAAFPLYPPQRPYPTPCGGACPDRAALRFAWCRGAPAGGTGGFRRVNSRGASAKCRLKFLYVSSFIFLTTYSTALYTS
jgi:hypothetical protein